MPEYQLDWVKIEDFLLIAQFLASPLFLQQSLDLWKREVDKKKLSLRYGALWVEYSNYYISGLIKGKTVKTLTSHYIFSRTLDK